MMLSKDELSCSTDDEEEEEHFTMAIKRRKLRTAVVLSLFLCTGLSYAIHGPSLVNLLELLNTDTVHISLALAATNGGYLLACVLCGLLFKRFDSELQFSLACLLMAVSLIGAPWSRDVYGFMVACAVNGFGMGYLDTGGNTFLLSVWNGHKAKEPLIQAMGFIWSLANILSTFLVRPFLVGEVNNSTCFHNASVVTTERVESADAAESGAICNVDRDITDIRYAYLVIGTIILGFTVVLIIVYCLMGHRFFRTEVFTSSSNASVQRSQLPWFFRCGIFVLVFIFFLLLEFEEGVGAGYISLFVVSELGWTVKQGATLMSIYWGAYSVSSLLAVPTSYVLSPKVMLYVIIGLTCTGYTLLLCVHILGSASVYAGYVLAGIGTSCIMPTMLLWAADFLDSSRTVTAVAQTGSGIGVIIGYPIVGALMENYSMMSYVYVTAGVSFSLLVLFVILHVLSLIGSHKREHPRDLEEAMNPFGT